MLSLALILCLPRFVWAFVYAFVNEERGASIITHPGAYSGSGGRLSITVGIDPDSPLADKMIVPVRNAIAVWNKRLATLDNEGLLSVDANDFETVALHELGHGLGLRHPNHDTGSAFESSYAGAFPGDDGEFTFNPGVDGRAGSGDDFRGDDVNLNWFQIGVNTPFEMAVRVDGSTYSRDLADLPIWDDFAAIGSPEAAAALGEPNTRALMFSVTPQGVHRRALAHDDVAGLRFAMAGLDEIEETRDDYFVDLRYIGVKAGADIMLSFDGFAEDSGDRLARTDLEGGPIDATGENTHARVITASITFDPREPWFFNDQLSPDNSAWQNGRDPLDSTDDGYVSARDALVIINALTPERGGSRVLTGEPGPGEYFYDVTGDGRLTPLDALRVINSLNSAPNGEGESIIMPAPTRVDRALEARSLDQQFGFHVPAWVASINYYADQPWNTEHVKFFLSSSWRWHYLTPAGELYEWRGNYDASVLLAILDSDYYSHPGLLYNAADQALSDTASN